MSSTVLDFINAGTGSHPVGERIAEWCKPYQAKELARMFDIAPQTAKSWRRGNLPQMKHLISMADRWGMAFLEDVFSPVLAETETSLAGRLERIEQDIHTLRRGAEDAERISANTGETTRLGGGKTRRGGEVVGRTIKSVGMIFATIAVFGTLIPSDNDMVRAPRPPVARVRRADA
jgi:hypothetical protein